MNFNRFTETTAGIVEGAALKLLARKVRTEVRVIEAKLPGLTGAKKRDHVTNAVVAWLDKKVVFAGRWAFLEEWDQEIIRVIVRAMVETAVDELRKADPMPEDEAPVAPVVAEAPASSPEPTPAA